MKEGRRNERRTKSPSSKSNGSSGSLIIPDSFGVECRGTPSKQILRPHQRRPLIIVIRFPPATLRCIPTATTTPWRTGLVRASSGGYHCPSCLSLPSSDGRSPYSLAWSTSLNRPSDKPQESIYHHVAGSAHLCRVVGARKVGYCLPLPRNVTESSAAPTSSSS